MLSSASSHNLFLAQLQWKTENPSSLYGLSALQLLSSLTNKPSQTPSTSHKRIWPVKTMIFSLQGARYNQESWGEQRFQSSDVPHVPPASLPGVGLPFTGPNPSPFFTCLSSTPAGCDSIWGEGDGASSQSCRRSALGSACCEADVTALYQCFLQRLRRDFSRTFLHDRLSARQSRG